MRKTDIIISLIIAPLFGAIIYFPTAHQTSPRFGVSLILMYLVLVAFATAASTLGKNKKEKGRVFFWGGLAVMLAVVPPVSDLVSMSSAITGDDRLLLDTGRAYYLILGSVFGISSIARGIQYWADFDLDKKNQKQLDAQSV
jgi:hypothetical protein